MENVVDFICGEVLAIAVASAQGAVMAVALKGTLGAFSVTILPGTYGAVTVVGAFAYGFFYSGMYIDFFYDDKEGKINFSSLLLGSISCCIGAYFLQTSIITALALAALNVGVSYIPVLLSNKSEAPDLKFITTRIVIAGLKIFKKLRLLEASANKIAEDLCVHLDENFVPKND